MRLFGHNRSMSAATIIRRWLSQLITRPYTWRGQNQNTFDKDYECMLEKRNLGVALTVTPQTPLNGTLIDSTYQTLTVKLTTPPAKPTAWPNVTIYVNNTAICTNQTAPATGLVSRHYQVTLPGRYVWNGTAQYGAVAPQPTFAFTAGMIEPISLVAGWNLYLATNCPREFSDKQGACSRHRD